VVNPKTKEAGLEYYRWQPRCGALIQLPVAAQLRIRDLQRKLGSAFFANFGCDP
jgi:hypothetical protein